MTDYTARRYARSAQSTAEDAKREIRRLRDSFNDTTGKILKQLEALEERLDAQQTQLDALEQAVVNPKSDAAEELAKKHGANPSGATESLKFVKKR